MEILKWAEGDEDVAFQYNIIKMVEDEKAEGRAQGLAEGRTAGRAEGERLKMIFLLRKKYRKGKTLSEVAEDLEEETSGLQQLYDLIAQHWEEDDETILSIYQSKDAQ